jgi:glc operon protein GlcG
LEIGTARAAVLVRRAAGVGQPINLETAKKVAAAAIAEAERRNWNTLCIAVVNPSGDLVYFEKQDNCQYASIGISQHKARTAARFRRPTLVFETQLGKGPYYAYLATLDDVIASRGGNPLVVDGKVIGAHRCKRRHRLAG